MPRLTATHTNQSHLDSINVKVVPLLQCPRETLQACTANGVERSFARTTHNTMPEQIHFHTDFYRREALENVAAKYQGKARIELADSGSHVVACLEPLLQADDLQTLRDEFC